MTDTTSGHTHPAEAAILASGLAVESREMPQLTRLVARRLPADRDAVAAALCEVRRKAWTGRLNDLANRTGQVWIRREDSAAAAATITEPEPDDALLAAALEKTVSARLRTAGASPEAALEAVAGDYADGTGHPLTAERHEALAFHVALAHGLDARAVERFVEATRKLDQRRRAELREAEITAREKRRGELLRQRAWEQSLVTVEGLPELLGCSPREALRWAGEGLLPVARKLREGRGREIWQFDPAEILPLRAEIAAWREAEQDAAPQGRAPAPEKPVRVGINKVGNAQIARVAALDRYAAHFATARALKRRIIIVTGPTNSGKSHMALDALARAQSGMALAPLRLLAHEFREALAARGVEASLTTGEERMLVPGARHVAATVEMCPFHMPVDVALIDEAQLLHDRDRGAAWTAAIMGAPARQVFVLGAPECVPMVKRMAQLCGDEVEEHSLTRKGPLHAASSPVSLHDLRTGDALVAFSRREVMDLRAALVQRGKRVAVVYGALSPEVRRAEAARFRSGEADILVATDAIGMGLNLPIRRVIFSALKKFDGEGQRALTSQEVKQIGGRAGRYGAHDEGIVAVLAGAGRPDFIDHMLHQPPAPPEELRPQVQPDSDIIAAVAAEIGTDSLYGVLTRIKRAVLRRDDPNYRLADMSQAMDIAAAVDGVAGLGLLDRWVYAMCPVDERDNGITRLARWAVEHGAGRPVRPPAAGRLPAPDRASGEELQRAEKIHKRLVAWRWLSLRFEEAYPYRDEAERETAVLDDWIEQVLRVQRRNRTVTKAA